AHCCPECYAQCGTLPVQDHPHGRHARRDSSQTCRTSTTYRPLFHVHYHGRDPARTKSPVAQASSSAQKIAPPSNFYCVLTSSFTILPFIKKSNYILRKIAG